MSEISLNKARIVSSVAATVISLACGTNVRYIALEELVTCLISAVCVFSMGASIRRETASDVDGE